MTRGNGRLLFLEKNLFGFQFFRFKFSTKMCEEHLYLPATYILASSGCQGSGTLCDVCFVWLCIAAPICSLGAWAKGNVLLSFIGGFKVTMKIVVAEFLTRSAFLGLGRKSVAMGGCSSPQ